MSQLELKIHLRGLGSIIQGERLAVPRYQRSYAWKKQNVEDFLDDIGAAVDDDKPEYFLGSIVLAGGAEAFEVVDGQQRLATSIILPAAIRDQLLRMDETQRADKIANDYLAKTDRRTLELEPHLSLNEVDQPYFHNAILLAPSERDPKLKPT